MHRFALKIEYDGEPFVGWQRQAEHPSVQGAIEDALRVLEPGVGSIQGAGRTDKGVHALGQVAHCDLEKDWDPFKLGEALNYHLKPQPISIVGVAPVPQDFNARFSAIERRYLFRILSRRAPAVFDRGHVWQINHPLDVDAMQAAANHLVGQHDFTTFRAVICQAKSPIKTLDEFSVKRVELPIGSEYHFELRARSFLHSQVRSFVGTLERVGAGTWHPDDVKQALDAKDRAACGPVSPPHGLYLTAVNYAEPIF